MTTRRMFTMLGVLYIAWFVVLLVIARQAIPGDDGHLGARFAQSDYQRCVSINPGPLDKPGRIDNRPHASAGRFA